MTKGLVAGPDGRLRCWWGASTPDYAVYHDEEWGRPVRDDRGMYERLCLEAFQSGLSWLTILRKREAFRAAFANFEPAKVAAFGDEDVARLMADAGIVRNRRKIEAAVANARATVTLREQGGLEAFLWSFRPAATPAPERTGEMVTTSPESLALSKALKKAGFAHVGPTTMYALMEAVGLVDDHLVGCHRRGASGVWA
jgi:DNA-3-methyladenine glycosylase I